jgi:hypothetical protein
MTGADGISSFTSHAKKLYRNVFSMGEN